MSVDSEESQPQKEGCSPEEGLEGTDHRDGGGWTRESARGSVDGRNGDKRTDESGALVAVGCGREKFLDGAPPYWLSPLGPETSGGRKRRRGRDREGRETTVPFDPLGRLCWRLPVTVTR